MLVSAFAFLSIVCFSLTFASDILFTFDYVYNAVGVKFINLTSVSYTVSEVYNHTIDVNSHLRVRDVDGRRISGVTNGSVLRNDDFSEMLSMSSKYDRVRPRRRRTRLICEEHLLGSFDKPLGTNTSTDGKLAPFGWSFVNYVAWPMKRIASVFYNPPKTTLMWYLLNYEIRGVAWYIMVTPANPGSASNGGYNESLDPFICSCVSEAMLMDKELYGCEVDSSFVGKLVVCSENADKCDYLIPPDTKIT